jgi:hypothetical protein
LLQPAWCRHLGYESLSAFYLNKSTTSPMKLPDFRKIFLPLLIILLFVRPDIMSEFIMNPTDAATMPPTITPFIKPFRIA